MKRGRGLGDGGLLKRGSRRLAGGSVFVVGGYARNVFRSFGLREDGKVISTLALICERPSGEKVGVEFGVGGRRIAGMLNAMDMLRVQKVMSL